MGTDSLTSSWRSLGAGPIQLSVLTGSALIVAGDTLPAANESAGLIVEATVGAVPTPLAAGQEYWAKALAYGTTIRKRPTPASGSAPTTDVLATLRQILLTGSASLGSPTDAAWSGQGAPTLFGLLALLLVGQATAGPPVAASNPSLIAALAV